MRTIFFVVAIAAAVVAGLYYGGWLDEDAERKVEEAGERLNEAASDVEDAAEDAIEETQ